MTDGYQGYNKVIKSSSDIIQAYCFAHAGRKFTDVDKITTDKNSKIYKLASDGLGFIDKLFHFKHTYEDSKYDYN